MQPAVLIQKKIEDTKESIKTRLEKIAATTRRVCCFASNSKLISKELSNLLNSLLSEVLREKNILTATNHTGNTQSETVAPELKIARFAYGIPLSDWDNHFRTSTEGQVYTNPAILPTILKSMHKIINNAIEQKKDPNRISFYNDFKRLKTFTIPDFSALISYMTYLWNTQATSPQIVLETREEKIKDLKLLIQSIANNIKCGPVYFGTGNCQLLAEIAFLLAIQTFNAMSIHYVKFQDSKGVIEELNAIVVGQWPKKPDYILAPSYQKEPFLWKGSLQNTPEIEQYDTINILFTVENEEEQSVLRQLLKTVNFDLEALQQEENRASFLKYIQDKSEELFECCQETRRLRSKMAL